MVFQLPPPTDPPAIIRPAETNPALHMLAAQPISLPPLPRSTPRSIHVHDPLRPTPSPAPSARLLNALLMSDENGDGVIESGTLLNQLSKLEQLARLPQTRSADSALLAAIRQVSASPIGAVRYWLPEDVLIISCATPDFSTGFAFEHLTLPKSLKDNLPANTKLGAMPGTFLCGQIFLASQLAALAPGSSILSTPAGEDAVGFLHIPRLPRFEARFRSQWIPPPPEHDPLVLALRDSVAGTVGDAIRGYEEQLREQLGPDQPLRILVTGFGPFGSDGSGIVENPSALLLGNIKLEFLKRSFMRAFEGGQVEQGEVRDVVFDSTALFTVQRLTLDLCARSDRGPLRPVMVRTVVFPTDAASVCPQNPASVQAEISSFQPHVHIGLGVSGEAGYRFGPFMSGMSTNMTCTIEPYVAQLRETHGNQFEPTNCVLRANFSLARAIVAGSRMRISGRPPP